MKVNKSNIRFLKIAGRISSSLIILFLIINVFGQIFFPERLIDIVGFRIFIVGDTGSMLPVLRYRDLAVIRRFDFDNLEVGDYVTFENRTSLHGEEQNIFVTHEIIEIVTDSETGQKAYRTSGIHPDIGPDRRIMTKDGANNTNAFHGKYVFHIRVPTEIRAFLMSIPGIITIIVNFLCSTAIGVLLLKDQKPTDEPFTI